MTIPDIIGQGIDAGTSLLDAIGYATWWLVGFLLVWLPIIAAGIGLRHAWRRLGMVHRWRALKARWRRP